jgi:hypothetical protein
MICNPSVVIRFKMVKTMIIFLNGLLFCLCLILDNNMFCIQPGTRHFKYRLKKMDILPIRAKVISAKSFVISIWVSVGIINQLVLVSNSLWRYSCSWETFFAQMDCHFTEMSLVDIYTVKFSLKTQYSTKILKNLTKKYMI